MLFDPGADVANDPRGVLGGPPAEIGLGLAGIRHVDAKVNVRGFGDGCDRDRVAGLLDAEKGQLFERD